MDAYELFLDYMRLDHQIDEFYHELAQRQGLSDSAFLVLWSVRELGEGCTQRDICRQFFLSKQTVNSSVRKLEREGFLALRPGEGREVRICLTDRGRTLVREKVLPVMEAERAAAQGDAAARRILERNARELAGLVWAVAGRLGLEAGQTGLYGGLLEHDTALRGLFLDEVKTRLPRMRCIAARRSAADGAALMARELLD